MNGECCQSYWVWIVVLYLYVKREYLAGVFWGLRGSLASVTPFVRVCLRFPVCPVCCFSYSLFTCMCEKRTCVMRVLCVVSEMFETMYDVKEMLVASPFFPLQWSLGMRWCHQSSVYVIEKKCLVVPSFAKVKTHTEVKLCLVLNKTMTLFLRCLEWSVPTFCVFGGQLNGSHDKVKAIPRWNFSWT